MLPFSFHRAFPNVLLSKATGNGHQCSTFGKDCRAEGEGGRLGGWARSCVQDCEIVKRDNEYEEGMTEEERRPNLCAFSLETGFSLHRGSSFSFPFFPGLPYPIE